MKVDRRTCGSEGRPGRVRTRIWVLLFRPGELERVPPESCEAAEMNCGKPSEAVRAVRLSCFFSCEVERRWVFVSEGGWRTRRRVATYNLARSLLVGQLKLLEVQ